MGDEKKTTTQEQSQSQTQRAKATPQEQRELDRREQLSIAAQPGQKQLAANLPNIFNNLLTGKGLPGFLQPLTQGISPEVTDEITQKAVADLLPSFQNAGILDSGVAASVAGRAADDIRRQSVQFNLNNLFNLLGLATGGATNVIQQGSNAAFQFGNQLAGLRTLTNSGTSRGVTESRGMNPFLKSFETSLGKTIGSGFGLGNIGGTEAAGKFFFN